MRWVFQEAGVTRRALLFKGGLFTDSSEVRATVDMLIWSGEEVNCGEVGPHLQASLETPEQAWGTVNAAVMYVADEGSVMAPPSLFPEEIIRRANVVEMAKAQFASRSEAGRYAAEQRWAGHEVKENNFKTITKSEYFALYDESKAHKNAIKEKGQLTDVEEYSLKSYTDWSYIAVNNVLRGQEVDDRGWGAAHITPEKMATELVGAIKKMTMPLPYDAVLFRGIPYESDLPFMEVGDTVTDDGVASASGERKLAREFGDGSKVDALMEIRVPKGTLVWVPETIHRREFEVALPPKTKFRVVERYEDNDEYGDVAVYVMEVVGV